MKLVQAASFALAMSLAAPTFAQSSADRAMAETLYQQGRALMDKKDYEGACAKFAESQRLDPATGTLLNLATCHERQGKLASAWLEYTEAASMARRDGRADRQQYAQQRAEALAPKLPRLTIELGPALDGLDVIVQLDGVTLRDAALGVAAPLDPGVHIVTAEAPGKRRFVQQVEIGDDAASETVVIAMLEDAPPGETSRAEAGGVTVTGAGVRSDVVERPLTTPIYIAGGATLLLAAGAVVTGILAHSATEKVRSMNEDGGETSLPEREDQHSTAETLRLTNAVLTGAAVAGAAVTTILFVTRPEKKTSAGLQWTPLVSPGFVGLSAGGTL